MSDEEVEAGWDYEQIRAQYAKMKANGTRLVGLEPLVADLTAELAAAEAKLAKAEKDYSDLVKHHTGCELAGTELCEAAKEAIIYASDGPSRDRVNAAMMAWDAHQWPALATYRQPPVSEEGEE